MISPVFRVGGRNGEGALPFELRLDKEKALLPFWRRASQALFADADGALCIEPRSPVHPWSTCKPSAQFQLTI
jgi:CRISPR/Cas system CMR-associated protein Cmr1 (group 7 of RAMP superfamily)